MLASDIAAEKRPAPALAPADPDTSTDIVTQPKQKKARKSKKGGKKPVVVHDKYWQLRPLKDLEGRGVTKIAGGQHHSMALAESAASDDSNPGTIYTWGRSDYGQLGVGDEDIDTGAGDFHNAPIEVSWRGRGGWRSGRADGTHIYVCLAPLRRFSIFWCAFLYSHTTTLASLS